MSWLRRGLVQAASVLVAIVLIFEEWGWQPLAALFARLARLPLFAAVERGIAALPPWAALAAFFAPALALFPIKVLALFAIARGHPMLGMLVLVGAKVVGTALLGWLFTLTQPTLMQLAWFARWYPRWKVWKDGVMAQVRGSAPWQAARRFNAAVRLRWSTWLHGRQPG